MLILALSLPSSSSAEPPKSSQSKSSPSKATKHKLEIRPAKDKRWKASPKDVEKVLYSAAGELWKYFPERNLKPILVEPKGGPIVLFKRGPNGEYRVRLDTGNTYWAQYAYQFAHEFCHILCNYDEDTHRNKWFEESLCETASLFALRRMAESWKTHPPYPNWKSFSSALSKYADKRLSKSKLPAGMTLAQWYKQNAQHLYSNATQREKNQIVAGVLLELFEKDPEHWEAVTYLNAAQSTKRQSFEDHLRQWQKHSPKKHRPFIRQIAKQFGFDLD